VIKKKHLSKEKLLLKIASYCAYQDRCFSEIETKLQEYDVSQEDKKELIDYLQDNNYLDETRFAKSVVRGKFNYKKWGRNKIKAFLFAKKIDSSDIELGLKEIKPQEYFLTLLNLAEAKKEKLAFKELDQFNEKQKLIAYLSQKGYEFDLISNALQEIYQ